MTLAPGAWGRLIDQGCHARRPTRFHVLRKLRSADPPMALPHRTGRFQARSGGTSRAVGARMLPTIAIRAHSDVVYLG